MNISIRKIVDSPYQGRFFANQSQQSIQVKKKLEELKNSIEQSGLMQPVTLRMVGDNYEIIDGHRRVEAYKQLGKGNIPAIIKEGSDKDIQVMSVVANLQRSNLSNLERAMAFEKIMTTGVFNTRKELSKAIGKDETYVGDIMNLLKLDHRILNHLATNNPTGDVRLLRLIRQAGKVDSQGVCEKQYKLYLQYVHQKWSREQLKYALEKAKNGDKPTTSKRVELNSGRKGYTLQIKDKLTKAQQTKFKEILEQKIQESLDELLND